MVSAAIHRENRTYIRALVTDKVAQGRATILHPYATCNGACARVIQVDIEETKTFNCDDSSNSFSVIFSLTSGLS